MVQWAANWRCRAVILKEKEMFSCGLIFSTSALISTWNTFISKAEAPSLGGIRHSWSNGWTDGKTESDWAGRRGSKQEGHLQCDPPAHEPMSQVATPPFWQPRLWADEWPPRFVASMPSPLVPDKIEDELEMTMVCHRPEGLEQLEAQTNFTKRELQVLYRGFKNVRPTGPLKAPAGSPIWD